MTVNRLLLAIFASCFMLPSLPGALAQAPPFPPPRFMQARDGSWTAASPRYTAAVNKEGYLSSFKVDGVEAVGDPFTYQPNAKLVADQSAAEGDTLHVHLKGNGEATIDYQFRPDGLTITPTWKGGGYGEFRFNASRELLGIELLNDKSVTTGGDATRFVEHGEIRGVPAVPSSRNQMVRFHYPHFNLHAYVQRWGAPFNYESAGAIRDYGWGRPLLDANAAVPIVFTLEKVAQSPTLPAPVFVPRSEKFASLYYAGEPCAWNMDLGAKKSYQYLLDAGIHSLDLGWRLLDIHDQPVASGKATINLDAAGDHAVQAVTLQPPGTGFFQALFTLADPSGKALTSSFLTRFTVIHQVPGMVNRDDSLAGKGYSDYAAMAVIGTGCIRESHNIGEFFSNTEQTTADWIKVEGAPVWMNIKSLDNLFNNALSESQKYHIPYFFQANSRPAYATPEIYEAMANALVSRYKDRCHTWEVENEPNFSYSPANYIKQSLVPFATGAKRADPGCHIMGPDCVSLKQTLEFMDVIYSTGANKWLDNISTHTYPGPGESWEQFGNLATIHELRQWMKEHGEGEKSLWQTEQGYAWDNSPRGQAARYTVRQFLEGARLGIPPDHQYYFYPVWHGFEDWYLEGGGEQGSETSWTPSGAALRFFAENVYGMEYAGDLPSPYKGIYLARFTGAAEDVVAAWTFDFPHTLLLKAPGLKSVVSFMGNPMTLAQDKPGIVSLPISGEPVYLHLAKGSMAEAMDPPYGRNLAEAASGGAAAASSENKNHPASFANDGNWNLWEDVIRIPGRTAWQSGRKDPTQENPDWLEVSFPLPRTINRMTALCYLPAVNASPRAFEFQVDAGGRWKAVAAGKDLWTWVIDRSFPPVTTSKIRMVIQGINDGWQGDRRWMHVLMGPKATNYTDSQALVSELEAYGPPTPVELHASVESPRKTAAFKTDSVTVEVLKLAGRALQGNIRVQAPAGWTAQPALLPVRMASRDTSSKLSFQLTAPQEIPVGTTPVALTFQGRDGKPLDASRLEIQVSAPVELTPQTPNTIKEEDQPLSVVIKNVTREPLNGIISLDTGGHGTAAPAQAPFGPLQPNASATVNFSAKSLKLVGAPVSLTYSARANGLVTTARQDLEVRGWQVLGPYPNESGTKGFDTPYDPEKGIDPGKSYTVLNGQSAQWQLAVADSRGFVDLAPHFNPHENVVAYAVVYVKSPTARQAILSAGSDDGIKAWINGKVVVSDNASRGAAPGQDEAPVQLKAGWNEVLLKITQGGYGWGFYFDLLDKNHQPIQDLVYSSHPR